MSVGEEMNTSSTGGRKASNDERYDLIPAEPLRLLAKLYGVGSKKYESRNWERGYDFGLSFAALNRHLWQWWNGQDLDPETGVPHTVAVMWHAAALTEFMTTHPEFDTRPKSEAPNLLPDVDWAPSKNVSVVVGGDNPAMDEAVGFDDAACAENTQKMAVDALGVDLETRKDLVERAQKAAESAGAVVVGRWNIDDYYRGGSVA